MSAKILIEEAMEKHRSIKRQVLTLLEKADSPKISKQKMKDELFKIYMEIK